MDEKYKIERRAYTFDIRSEEAEDGVRILKGRPIVYNSRTNLGLFDEVIEAGALDKTDLRDVRFLVNHDTSKIPLARSRRNNSNSTMKFTVDAEGMNLDWVKLDTKNNSEARSLASAVDRGDITGMSFMFALDPDADVVWEGLETDHPTRHVMNIRSVFEVSAVTFPAYESAEISARSNEEALESARRALDRAKEAEKAESVETDLLELEKAKTLIIGGK